MAPSKSKTAKPPRIQPPEHYTHPTAELLLRPDMGTQAQFRKKKPPKTYRYDSSLSPELNWDASPAREIGDWLLAQIEEAARLPAPHRFDKPRELRGNDGAILAGVSGLSDAVEQLKRLAKPFLNWAGKAERLSFDVPTLPLFIHERLSTAAILETLKGHKRDKQLTMFDLFADREHPIHDQVLRAYEHKNGWVNRMILGDSLVVMNSLLNCEGLGGQVQCIYMDPPYGVKFGSNFQPFVRKRDVKHNDDADLTREPEMVKAYRDTWELGLHSYLTYMRDRLLLARELLAPSGSIFVQISDENVHHVRELMDEVFGSTNFVGVINVAKTSGLASVDSLAVACDYLLWFGRTRERIKYRPLFVRREPFGDEATIYGHVELTDRTRRSMSKEERLGRVGLPDGARRYRLDNLTKPGPGSRFDFDFEDRTFNPGKRWWGTTPESMLSLAEQRRLQVAGNTLCFVRFWDDFPFRSVNNLWDDMGGGGFLEEKLYVVQTRVSIIDRCILMTTDPGDLVLDPTCFRAGTRVNAESGWVSIETVRAGQRVWTHRGRLRRVAGVQSRPHVGPMVGLKLSGLDERVWCTPEHQFLVSRATNLTPQPPLHIVERGSGGEAAQGENLTPQPPLHIVERGRGGEAEHDGDPTPVPPPHAWGGGQGERRPITDARPNTNAHPTPDAPTHHHVHARLGGPAGATIVSHARALRCDATRAEKVLWEELRARRLLGAKFRRQHPLGPHYISDFYCPDARLAIELDGGVHDARRTRWADGIRHGQLQAAGVHVLRFRNERVFEDLVGVVREIAEHLTPQPPLHIVERGRGGEAATGGDPTPIPPPQKWGGGQGERSAGSEHPTPSPPPHAWGGGRGERSTPSMSDDSVAEALQWIEARNLAPGDLIADGRGTSASVDDIEYAHADELVYDLTVEDDHSFITRVGVAHNCGSGTTAYVAERWGRRWITIDTSRVPLALARQRLLTATFDYYELQDESRGPAGGFVYQRKQNKKGEEVGGIVPHVMLESIANNEPPQEEVLVDRPEEDKKITRVTGPFCVEATIPTPVGWDESEPGAPATGGVPSRDRKGAGNSSDPSDSSYGSDSSRFLDRMLEVLRRSPVLQLGGGKSVTLKNVRAPAKTLSLSAEAIVEGGVPGQAKALDEAVQESLEKDGHALPLSGKPVAIVFGPENGAISEKLAYEGAREANAKQHAHLFVIGFAIQPNARKLIEECERAVGIAATYVQATPDLVMGDLLKNMRSSQIFSVCGLPEVALRKADPQAVTAVGGDPKAGSWYEVELLGLDVFDPTTMETDQRKGDDVPAWFLDTDYNGLCFHVSQAFFPRTAAWDDLKRSLLAEFDPSVWDHLAGTVSAPFEAGKHGEIAVKVIDDRGNELLVVKGLGEVK